MLLYSLATLLPVLAESNLFVPRGIGQGITYDVKDFNQQDLVLNTTSDTITLDYGAITSGFPLVEVDVTEGTGEVEVLITYSEGYPGLSEPFGDGPYMFSSMLSNNFRTEAINVTDILVNHDGLFQSYFIQGSQRWQSLKLVKGDGVRFKRIGFVPTSTTTEKQNESGDATSVDLNSTFACSKPMLERLWHLGPKSLQHACVSAGTQPTTWDRAEDGESGVFVRGQRAARLANVTGILPKQYTLDFEVKIQRGGFGWQMDAGVGGTSRAFYVTTDLTEPMVPAGWNRSLLSPNTLTLGAGFALVNQTTLPGYLYDRIPLNSVGADQWIKVSTTSSGGSLYNVSLDGQQVVSVNTSSYGYLPGDSPFYLGPSTVALGGWQDQDAYYRNLVVSDGNGTLIYENNLNGDKVREEFGVTTNAYSQCPASKAHLYNRNNQYLTLAKPSHRLHLRDKMYNHHEIPILVLIFFACAWWFNVEFPPNPWQTWWIVLIIQSGLLWYSHQLTHLIWNGVEGTQCTIRRRCLAVSIILLSSILLVGYASCRNGRWVGIVTHDQEDMVGATAVAEILLGFFYFGCTVTIGVGRSLESLKSEDTTPALQKDIEMGEEKANEAGLPQDDVQQAVDSKTG